MNAKVLLIAALIIVGVLVVAMNSNRPTAPQGAVSGEVLYERNCASCHGINLEGQANWQTQNPDGSWPAPPHNATGHTWHHSDEYLRSVILMGGAAVTGTQTNMMPGFQSVLSVNQVDAILTYIKSTWPEEIRTQQQSMQ